MNKYIFIIAQTIDTTILFCLQYQTKEVVEMLIQNSEGRLGRLHRCGFESTFSWLEGKPIITVDLSPAVIADFGSFEGCEAWPAICRIIQERQNLIVMLAAGRPGGDVQFWGALKSKTRLNRRWLTDVTDCGGLMIVINPYAEEGRLLVGKAIACTNIRWNRKQFEVKGLVLPGWVLQINLNTPVFPPENFVAEEKWRNLSGKS